ncbi:mechanosensitive ion channel family protein [Candidatus Parcubacteria bacterium]|nr:mechanosensitive ion channel family protein [Candidatus Parcubacteria bacterium]
MPFNFINEYLLAIAVFGLAFFVLNIFRNVGLKKLKKLASKTKTEYDDLLVKILASISLWFYCLLSLWLAFQVVSISEKVAKYFSYLIFIAVVYYLVKAFQELIDFAFVKLLAQREQEGKKIDVSAIALLSKILKIALWATAILLVLQNLGFNVTTLVAGLGIGGVAIAFALQGILSDVFACFSIYFDKPFETGDYIVIDKDSGTVKKIGIKSTRIQTLQGEELVISNKELTAKRIHNYKKMEKRRIVFNFGVVYETGVEKLKKIPEIVKEIIGKFEIAELNRVHFKEFGDFSLNFEVVYYLNSKEYQKYMDTQQEINLALKDAFEKQGIEFAYPTQTILLSKSQAKI